MGSQIEINDTLQITTEQGFPADILSLEKHRQNPIPFEAIKDQVFVFHDKEGARLYHQPPTRCFLVQNIGGKWVYWGKILILEQTIHSDGPMSTTSGKYKIIELYDPTYQELVTKRETNEGKSYF